jgi:excinuclease UvrABC nuclease subunit
MRKQREKNQNMSFDQQIRIYEDRINQLEQMKRTLILQSSDNSDLSRINVDLDENYQHIAILKIRKMMGF